MGVGWALSSLFPATTAPGAPTSGFISDNARLDNAESTNPGHLQAPVLGMARGAPTALPEVTQHTSI